MKCSTAALSIATLSLAMLTPAFGQAPNQSWHNNHNQNWHNNNGNGQQEADHMVRARASLDHSLDADSVRAGAQFRATLSDDVHLNDGVELHRGDALLGRVVTDNMNTPGNSRLAVRFTRAVRKNGQDVPIKATIVAFYTPGKLINNSWSEPEQIPNTWNDGTLRVDQLGVMKGVDFHSRIAGPNSGVFVSMTKNNFKIPAGSEFALAITARNNGPANPANSGS